MQKEGLGWRRAGGSASLLNSMQSDQKEACTFSLQRLSRHPFHGALKRKPSGIPSAAIVRSQCFSQFQLSFFRRRVGTPPLRCKSLDAACFLESVETGPVAYRLVPSLGWEPMTFLLCAEETHRICRNWKLSRRDKLADLFNCKVSINQ
jgi:hypothetical protein